MVVNKMEENKEIIEEVKEEIITGEEHVPVEEVITPDEEKKEE